MEVAIVGGGNFGTAVAHIAARNGYVTHLWKRNNWCHTPPPATGS